MLKKIIAAITAAASLIFASPAFAYTVNNGDTMSKIAQENNLELEELVRLNPQIDNIDLIYVGQTINTYNQETTSKPVNAEIQARYSDYEIDLLARLVRAEAQSESFQGKIAVACVVLNRVDSRDFPNTIEGVIYEKGQFQPVQNGEINQPADEESIKAVHEALKEHRKMANGSLYFYNPAIATNHWLDSRVTTLVIGQHVFKK